MTNLYRTILSIALLTCALLCADNISAQITLNQLTERGKQGIVESITFEYVDTSVPVAPGAQPVMATKVFDIQANNPYNKLDYPVKGKEWSGSNIYEIPVSEVTGVNSTLLSGFENGGITKLEIVSFSVVSKSGEFVVVAYERFYTTTMDYLDEGIKSTLVVLNARGDEIFRLDLESDNLFPTVTENGKYLAFATGEMLEHSIGNSVPMLYIFNIETGEEHYSEEIDISSMGFYKSMVRASSRKAGKTVSTILDQFTGDIYRCETDGIGSLSTLDYNKFKFQGNELTFDDFTKIK